MATINGTDGNDTLIGTPTDKSGNGGADIINGFGGDDVIDGRGGDDKIDAGAGNDTVLLTTVPANVAGTASVLGGDGYDTLDARQFLGRLQYSISLDAITVRYGQRAIMSASGIESVIGTNGVDSFVSNLIVPPIPGSTLELFGGNGEDDFSISSIKQGIVVHGGNGNDTIWTATSAYGDAGNDYIWPIDFVDGSVFDGGAGGDTLILAVHNNYTVDLRAGLLQASGGVFPDRTAVASSFEMVNLTQYQDTGNYSVTVYGTDSDNFLNAASIKSPVHFYGRDGNDNLYGSSGADTLEGGAGNDILYGGRDGGNDLLIGGSGVDRVVINQKSSDVSFAVGTDYLDVIEPSGRINRLVGVEQISFSDRVIDNADGKPLVVDTFYLATYSDVLKSKLDADVHYDLYGWTEGRDPNSYFSTVGYLGAYSDVNTAHINPLLHYDLYGWKEGRDPSAKFDTTLYLLHNPDVAALGIDPFAHFLDVGADEGRQAYAAIGPTILADGFDPEYYLLSNPEVAAAALAAGGDTATFAYQHYQSVGWKEGRDPNAWFDDAGYLAAYQDVARSGLNPLSHFAVYGWTEGRDPSAGFDTTSYLAANSDVAAAGVNPLIHYLEHGAYAGLATFGDGAFDIIG